MPPAQDLLLDIWIAMTYSHSGRRIEALQLIEMWEHLTAQRSIDSFPLAWVNADVGRVDRVFELLERAYQDHSPNLPWMLSMPHMLAQENLFSDPRFQDFCRRIGLQWQGSLA